MEQHPVPQNVTTFQFRLIGDMTIKQFGYLAGGAILAYISFKLPLPFFFTWPLTILFGVGGVGFAFVPIEERPMDVWVLSFLKNVYSPTLYVWEKSESVPTQPTAQKTVQQQTRPMPAATRPQVAPQTAQPISQDRSKAAIVSTMYNNSPTQQRPQPQIAQQPRMQNPQNRPPAPGPFDWLTSLFSKKATPPQNTSQVLHQAANVSNPSITGSHLDISMPPSVSSVPRPPPQVNIDVQKREEALQTKTSQLQHELENKSMTESRILELQKQLSEVIMQKDKMEQEVIALRRQVSPQQQGQQLPPIRPASQTPIAPSATQHMAAPHAKQPTVKIITPESAVKAGLPRLTTFPNVVTGIIKENETNLLPGVLVTVKDKDGVPVRALKSNRLGQFAASTPLANGVYFVEIEDPRGRYAFDRVQITLNGSIVPALEIIAKSQKEISRAQLAKEIFGNTT